MTEIFKILTSYRAVCTICGFMMGYYNEPHKAEMHAAEHVFEKHNERISELPKHLVDWL